MKTFKTKKEILAALKSSGKARKMYAAPHMEDRAEIIQEISMQLIEQGASLAEIEITDNEISIGTQFWRLPKHPSAGEIVTVVVRSKDIKSGSAYGDISGWVLSNDKTHLIHKVSGAELHPFR